MTTDQLLKCLTLFMEDHEILWSLAKILDVSAFDVEQRYKDTLAFWDRVLNSEKIQFSESYQVKLQHFTSVFCDLLITQLRRISVNSNPLLLVACQRTSMSPQTLWSGLLYVKTRVVTKTT